jgi:hypothetical protein
MALFFGIALICAVFYSDTQDNIYLFGALGCCVLIVFNMKMAELSEGNNPDEVIDNYEDYDYINDSHNPNSY